MPPSQRNHVKRACCSLVGGDVADHAVAACPRCQSLAAFLRWTRREILVRPAAVLGKSRTTKFRCGESGRTLMNDLCRLTSAELSAVRQSQIDFRILLAQSAATSEAGSRHIVVMKYGCGCAFGNGGDVMAPQPSPAVPPRVVGA